MSHGKRIVVVGGCGHVGLPLGIVFASKGMRVDLLDIENARVETVNAGRMPFIEPGAEEVLRSVLHTRLQATCDPGCLHEADAVIAVVGTPVDHHLNPTVKELYRSLDELIGNMRDGALLVLRSTVYPGVTKLVFDRVVARKRSIHVAFCPERIAEGKAMEELTEMPQIVAAFTAEAMAAAKELFSTINPNLVELDPLEAELAKLFTNSWRYLNFAVSNQFYILAQHYGLDFYRIHDAATRDYPRMRSFARAGFAAGPCLVKDTLQLATFSGNQFFLGHAAMLINEGLPNFIVSQLQKDGLSSKTVAILGMAFKADSDDSRESLSYKLKNLLEVQAHSVLCTDPYVKDSCIVPLEDAIQRADIIILGAPHSIYKNLEVPADKKVVDVWGFWRTHRPRTLSALAGTR